MIIPSKSPQKIIKIINEGALSGLLRMFANCSRIASATAMHLPQLHAFLLVTSVQQQYP